MFSQVNLCLGEILPSCNRETGQRFLDISPSIKQTIAPHNAKPIMAFLVTIASPAFEPYLRHLHVRTNAFSSKEHPTQITSGGSREPHWTIFVPFSHMVARIAWPHLPRNGFEVVSCALKVPRYTSDSLAARCDTSWCIVYTSVVEDLSEAESKVGFTTVCIELSPVKRYWSRTG